MRHHYWRSTDFEQVNHAQSYDDLLEVALRVIERTPAPIHQVCGPISTGGRGSVQANLEEFDRAIEYFSQHVNVFDQMPFEHPMQRLKKTEDRDLMDVFYKPIFSSGEIDTLLFLPGWRSSTGARTEWEWADEHGIDKIELPEDWDERTDYLP